MPLLIACNLQNTEVSEIAVRILLGDADAWSISVTPSELESIGPATDNNSRKNKFKQFLIQLKEYKKVLLETKQQVSSLSFIDSFVSYFVLRVIK